MCVTLLRCCCRVRGVAVSLAAFTPNCGCTAYGYEIPSLVEIARSSYCVHFLGGKTKKRFSEYSTKLLQMVPNQ